MTEEQSAPTARREYAERLERLSGARWKRILHVQAPFQAHIRSLHLGRTLDVGCGTGRNLAYLDSSSVGVDHNPDSVAIARKAGFAAYTIDQLLADPQLSAAGSYDSLLCAHVIEHLAPEEAHDVLAGYLPLVAAGGKVVFITPQERGFASDETHVAFADWASLGALATGLGLRVERQYSFPFPRFVGRLFTYNEFVQVARV